LKIGFNARLLHAPTLRGWNRYAINLLAELSRQANVSLVLYSDRPIHESHMARIDPTRVVVRVAPGDALFLGGTALAAEPMRHRCRQFAAFAVQLRPALVVSMSARVNAHDAIFAASESLSLRLSVAGTANRLSHWISRTRAERIITVSQHAKSDIVRRWKIDPDRIA